MRDDDIRSQPGFAELDDATLAVFRLVTSAQDLTVRTARAVAMNVTDMSAILLLSREGPLGVAELARRLGVSSPAATVLVDRLQRAGLAERAPDAADRRRVRVSATAAALEVTGRAWSPAIDRIDAVCRTIPRAQRGLVLDVLTRLAVTMSGSEGPAGTPPTRGADGDATVGPTPPGDLDPSSYRNS